MKNMPLKLIISLMSLACSNNNEEPQNNIPAELIGKWKIVERFTSDGTSGYWHSYDSEYFYDLWLKANGTFSTEDEDACSNCTYIVLNNQITFYPYGVDYPSNIESLSNEELILNANHFEPIKTKYVKIFE